MRLGLLGLLGLGAAALLRRQGGCAYLQDCLGVRLDKNIFYPPEKVTVIYDLAEVRSASGGASVGGSFDTVVADAEGDPLPPEDTLCFAIQWAGLVTGKNRGACPGHEGFRQQAC